MSGVSARTLRYYDEIDLLKPARVASTGYRIYGQREIDRLQEILFYKEMGFALADIKNLLTDPDFNREEAFQNHLKELEKMKDRLDKLILNVNKTLGTMRRSETMSDKEKFEGFKQELIEENEKKYGEEIRQKYGDEEVDDSYAKIKGMTKEKHDELVSLNKQIEENLRAAVPSNNPAGELAQETARLHAKWLVFFYPKYNKEYHLAMAELYVADERFKEYYENIVAGGAEFISEAIRIYCQDK